MHDMLSCPTWNWGKEDLDFFLPMALHYILMTSNSCLFSILLAFVYRHFLLILFLFFIFCFRTPSPALLCMSEPHDGSFELHNSFPSPSFLRSLKHTQKVCQFWTLGGWYTFWIPCNREKVGFYGGNSGLCVPKPTSLLFCPLLAISLLAPERAMNCILPIFCSFHGILERLLY